MPCSANVGVFHISICGMADKIVENMGNYGLWHLIIPVKSNGSKAVFPLHHEGSMFVLVGAVRSDHKSQYFVGIHTTQETLFDRGQVYMTVTEKRRQRQKCQFSYD